MKRLLLALLLFATQAHSFTIKTDAEENRPDSIRYITDMQKYSSHMEFYKDSMSWKQEEPEIVTISYYNEWGELTTAPCTDCTNNQQTAWIGTPRIGTVLAHTEPKALVIPMSKDGYSDGEIIIDLTRFSKKELEGKRISFEIISKDMVKVHSGAKESTLTITNGGLLTIAKNDALSSEQLLIDELRKENDALKEQVATLTNALAEMSKSN